MSDTNNGPTQTDKNSVFSTDGIKGVENISRQDYAKREIGLEIPVNAVNLPSRGRVYGPDHPLHMVESVEYRGMTPREEDILMTPAFIKKGTVVTELIKACLMDKRIDVSTLVTGDRNALMIAIRSAGYGHIYEPSYTCPACDSKNDMHINLNELEIKPLSVNPVAEGVNAFKFRLPKCERDVSFRIATGKDEEELASMAESKKKKGIINTNPVTMRLMSALVEIDGKTDRGLINKFVQNMPAQDSIALRKYMDEIEPGIQSTVDFTCNACGHGEEISMPFGVTFLYPNAKV